MKTIKIYLLVTLAIALVYVGLYSFGFGDAKEGTVEMEKTEPYSYPLHVDNLLSLKKGKIEPVEKWKSILTGKWDFKVDQRQGNNIRFVSGVLDFLEDSLFTRILKIEDYEYHGSTNDIANPRTYQLRQSPSWIAQGTASGNWFVNTNSLKWVENYTESNIVYTHHPNEKKIGTNYTAMKGNASYGYDSPTRKLIKFSDKEIIYVMEGNSSSYFIFRKQ